MLDRLRGAASGIFGVHAQHSLALGASLGALWPLGAVLAGAPADPLATFPFVVGSAALGLAAGAAHALLARRTIGGRAERLAEQMRATSDLARRTALGGGLGHRAAGRFRLEPITPDAFGRCAAAYSDLAEVLRRTSDVDGATRAFSETLCESFDLDRIGKKALQRLLEKVPRVAAALVVAQDGELRTAADVGFIRTDDLPAWEPLGDALRAGLGALPAVPRGGDEEDEGDEGHAEGRANDGIVRVPLGRDLRFRSMLKKPKVTDAHLLPIVFRGVPVAVLVLAGKHDLSAEERAVLLRLRPVVGVAIKNALAHAALRRVSSFDLMTGLYTRPLGLKMLREGLIDALRGGTSVGVLLVDVDNLGEMNETHGRILGDRAIVHVAQCVRKLLRASDALSRFGGDELLVTLKGATREDTRAFAERIAVAVGAIELEEGPEPLRVTVSVGGVAFPHDPVEHEEQLVEHAEAALAAAKARGPGGISIFRPAPEGREGGRPRESGHVRGSGPARRERA